MRKKLNLDRLKNVHLIGIGGCGVSAIGKILHEMGYNVSGSDLKENSNTIRLRDLGIKIFLKHDQQNLRGADLVVVSSAIPENNPEIEQAKSSGIPILKRAQMLSYILSKHKFPVGIAGTHGKTTTTSMLSKVLLENGLDPTFLIGGETDFVDGNARLGKGPYAVAEADESDGSFLELDPKIGVITNIEADHMEYFKNENSLFKHFRDFAQKVKEKNGFIVCSDHPNCKKALSGLEVKKITYGFNEDNDFYADKFEFSDNITKFRIFNKKVSLGEVTLTIPGKQNISNAMAAIAIGLEFGLPFESIATALQSYQPVKRRFQIIGEVDDILIVDDYAHHPTEVKATINAAKMAYSDPERRIIAIFQPHRYSRTFWQAKEFAKSFSEADKIIITDVYAAGEAPIPNVNGRTITRKIPEKDKVNYFPKKEKIAAFLLDKLQPNDIVLTMGAGDISNVAKELLSRLKIKDETTSE